MTDRAGVQCARLWHGRLARERGRWSAHGRLLLPACSHSHSCRRHFPGHLARLPGACGVNQDATPEATGETPRLSGGLATTVTLENNYDKHDRCWCDALPEVRVHPEPFFFNVLPRYQPPDSRVASPMWPLVFAAMPDTMNTRPVPNGRLAAAAMWHHSGGALSPCTRTPQGATLRAVAHSPPVANLPPCYM